MNKGSLRQPIIAFALTFTLFSIINDALSLGGYNTATDVPLREKYIIPMIATVCILLFSRKKLE